MQASRWSGPLPPPDVLVNYNAAFPGAAERIVQMAEEQSAHRRSLEGSVVQANIRAQSRGQWLGFLLALVIIAIGGGLLFMGRSVEGFALLIGDVATLLFAFVWGRTRQEKDRREKMG